MLKKAEAAKRAAKLRTLIDHYRRLYHQRDTLAISDEAFDALKHELKAIEDAFPELVRPDSPTQRVGASPLARFAKVRHQVKQWSLEDAFNDDEARAFDERVRRLLNATPHYTCELKIDGLHVVLTYERGVLALGATRGNGLIGEDVTQNLRTIQDLPQTLSAPVSLVVEGEVYMRRSVWQALNRALAKAGKPLLANPRNAAAGAIRQLDPAVAAERRLSCFAYDISAPEKALPPSQAKELEYLRALGFTVNDAYRRVESIGAVLEFWHRWAAKRESVDYWLDGVVVKVDERAFQRRLGYTGKAPRWALALKFPGEETATRIRRIIIGMGRTGKLTPVAVLEPVRLMGTTVTHATLHNADEVLRLDARVGDTVIVKKAGDVIPQVVRVLRELRPPRTKPFTMPRRCPFCGGPVRQLKGEANTICLNARCGARRAERLKFFVSKRGFDMAGLGDKIVERLMEEGLVKEPADFFKLTQANLIDLPGFGEISAQKIIGTIQSRRARPLKDVLTSLGIPRVGEEKAAGLAEFLTSRSRKPIRTIPALLTIVDALTPADYETIAGFGQIVASSAAEFFRTPSERRLIEHLAAAGVLIVGQAVAGRVPGPLNGRVFLFTGTLTSYSRTAARAVVEQRGGRVARQVRGDVTDVVVGQDPGSKADEAVKRGIRTISEAEFLSLLSPVV